MKILINIVAAIPIIFMLIFAIGAIRDGLRQKAWNGRALKDDEIAIRFFISVASFIIVFVMLVFLAIVNASL